MSTNDLSKSVIFPIGEKLESDHFNGTVWLSMLVPVGSACPIGNVTFEPGGRKGQLVCAPCDRDRSGKRSGDMAGAGLGR